MAIFEKLPYTNYHNLNADWIVKKVKEIAEAWTEYRDSMDEWKDGVDAELQTFHEWFDNLDLTDEVRTIIEEMVQDGSFMTAATPVITSATEAWLAAHVSQGYAVDNTLTISGAAADAKVTGDRITQLKEDLTAIAIRPTVSGDIASFTDGAEDVPMKSLVVNIEPVQSGSGDPSPTNVRPITGWTEVKTTRAGANLWDEEWEIGSFSNHIWVPSTSGYVGAKNPIPVRGGSTYYSKCPVALDTGFYDIEGNWISTITISPNTTFITPSNAKTMRFRTYAAYGQTYNNDISINYPATDTAYHSGADNEQYTTALGQTVYGGALDVVSGELVIDRAMLDLSTAGASYNSTWNCWTLSSITNAKPASSNTAPIDAIATTMKAVQASGYTTSHASGTFASNTSGIWFFDNGSTTNLTGSLLYELATPTTVQLTAQEVTTLLGANNVFADAGSVDVTYLADGKLYIDNRIAELQALILEQ